MFADSLVSSHVYEIIRTIYNTPTADGTDGARVSVLQQTLSQLRLTNIATLDACMNHFTRLIDLTSADEAYVASLATALAPCILRPRTQTSLTMEEKHAYKLLRDLFAHKDAIFSELKRMSTLSHSSSVGANNRPRAISTDESNRKAHMEERNRALLEKASGGRSRATSPAPGPRGSHRRDRSIGGPETRFPIASPTTPRDPHRQSMGPVLGAKRQSLEVPGSEPDQPVPANGVTDSPTSVRTSADSIEGIEKRDSLKRSSVRFVGGRRVGPSVPSAAAAPQVAAVPEHHPGAHSVTLVDRPMED